MATAARAATALPEGAARATAAVEAAVASAS